MNAIRMLLLAWLIGAAAPLAAQTHAYSAYVDLDNTPGTGCTITTAAGPVPGIEAVLTAEVSVDPPQVVAQNLTRCQSGALGAPVAITGNYPYPVGFDLGAGGFDVVELGAPLHQFGATPTQIDWRVTFGSQGALLGGADLSDSVLVPRLGFAYANPTFVPATSLTVLALLALALGAATVWAARRRPQLLSLLVVSLTLGLSGLAWAAVHVLDGAIGDWPATAQVLDPPADATQDEPPIDIRQGFAEAQGGRVYFRIDVEETRLSELIPPLIDSAFQIAENSPNGTALGPVRPAATGLSSLLNLALTSQTPAAALAFDPASSVLSVANSGLLDFETHPAFQLGLDATLSGVTGYSLPVTVQVDVLDVNEAPTLAPQGFSVLEEAANGTVLGTVLASDVDAGVNGQLGFAISGGSGQTVFAIDPGTGQLSVANAAAVLPSASPFTLNVTVSDGGSPALTASATMTITVTDVNDAPSFTAGGDVGVLEDSGAYDQPWASALSDGDDGSQTLTFDVLSNDNPGLFAVGPVIDVLGSIGQLRFTPAPDANGVANLTVRLRDDGGTANGGVDQSATVSLQIAVTAVNDAPSFSAGANPTVLEDAGAQTLAGWATAISAGPADEAGQTLSFQILSNSNPALFSAAPAVSAAGDLSFTAAPDANGSATLTLQLSDNGGTVNGGLDTSAPQSFTITVTAVNDAPSFSAGANPTVLEDAGAQTLAGWATAISAGPADEAGQTLSFQILSNSNPALFSAAPAVSAAGDLSFTAAPDANGSATLTLQLSDNGGTVNGGLDTSAPQSFTITVTAVNDAPSFTAGANPTVLEDAGAQTLAGWATAISAGPADEAGQTLSFQILSNSNPALFSAAPAVSAAGDLSFTAAPDASGSATLTLQLSDNGGTANGGLDTSAPQSFTITVTAVNDAPVNAVPGAQAIDEDTTLAFSGANAISVADVDLDGGALGADLGVLHGTLTATASGAATVSGSGTALLQVSGTLADVNATLTSLVYTPNADFNGSDALTLTSSDNGNTGSGGVQTDTDTVAISVAAINDAPVNTVPGTQQVIAGTLSFSTANGNALAVFDVDADPGNVQLDLSVTAGTLTLTAVPHPDLSITGNGSDAITLTGQQTHINAVLEGMVYATASTGTETLLMLSDDLGNSGAGGALTDTDSVTLLMDQAPEVSATSPGAGAVVASNAAILIQFSEAVDVSAGGVTLSCGGANLIVSGDSGSGVTQLTPGYSGSLPEGGSCVLTVLASHVTDVDSIDPPDVMAADHIVNFSVDVAPSVIATVPAPGASDLPTGTVMSLTFSEAVNVGVSSFSLSCGGSPVAFSVSGSGTASVTLTPTAPLPAGASCTATALAAGVADVDAIDPPDLMGANHAWSFSTDAAPEVSGTVPAAGDVVITTPSITVTFSEPVNLGAGAFSLNCGAAVATTATPALPASGVTSISFVPNAALPEGASCTATVLASAVQDADSNDPPDTMAADHTWTFVVDAAPAVLSITPAAGAVNVTPTSAIVITFSETVNFDTAANAANTSFDLECPTGTPVAFTVATASPSASVTLDPLDAAIAGQSCSLIVRSAGISDADAVDPPDAMAVDVAAGFSFGAIANDDSVNVTPHLTVSTAGGAINLTGNDVLGAGQVTGFGFGGACTGTAPGSQLDAGAANGRLTIAADGSFSYEPPAGVANATRSFCYTVTGGDTAAVSFSIQNDELVWFVDASAGAGGSGTQARPFQTLTAAAAASTANDTLYVAYSASAYAAGITLQSGQRLIGQGTSGSLASYSGVTPVTGSAFPATGGSAPSFTTSGTVAITLGNGNTLSGFSVGDTGAAGTDIAGSNFGTLRVDAVRMVGTGRALQLDTGSVIGTGFLETSVTSSSSEGLRIHAVSGTLALGSGAIVGTGAGVPALHVTGSVGSITYAGSLSKTSSGRLVEISGAGSGNVTLSGALSCTSSCGNGVHVANRTGGILLFSGSGKMFHTGTNIGVELHSNTGATIQFSGGGLDISTTTATGFSATGGGSVTVQGVGNTVTSTSGRAIDVVNTTIAGELRFQSVSSNGAPSGIVLNTTGSSGGLSVTGTGTANSGGTIQSSTGAGVSLTGTQAVSLAYLQVRGSADHGISAVNVNGLSLDNASLLNNGNAVTDEGIRLSQVSGAISITNSTFTNSAHNSVYLQNTSGTVSSLTLSGNNFTSNHASTGNHHLLIEGVTGSPQFTAITINNNSFSNARSIGVQIAANNSTAFASVAITNNTFSNNVLAIDASAVQGAALAFRATGNTINSTVSGGSHALNSNHGIPSTGTLRGRLENNLIGTAGVTGSGSPIGNGIRLVGNDNGAKHFLAAGNTIRETRYGRGIEALNRNGTGRMDVTVTGNTINTDAQPSDLPLAGIHVQSNCVATCNSLRADIADNSVTPPSGGCTGDLLGTCLQLVETSASTCELLDRAPTGAATAQAELVNNNPGSPSTSASAGCALTTIAPILPP